MNDLVSAVLSKFTTSDLTQIFDVDGGSLQVQLTTTFNRLVSMEDISQVNVMILCKL